MKAIKIGALALMAVLVLSAIAYAAGPDRPAKPDKHKPVPATNVELVKKVTVRRPGPPIKPPWSRQEKEEKGDSNRYFG